MNSCGHAKPGVPQLVAPVPVQIIHQLEWVRFFKINFCRTIVHLVGPLIAPISDFRVTFPMGFKARVVLSPAHSLSCA